MAKKFNLKILKDFTEIYEYNNLFETKYKPVIFYKNSQVFYFQSNY